MTAATLSPRLAAPSSDFAPLARRVRELGLLRRRRGYYAGVVASDSLLLAGAVVIVLAGAGWWALLGAVPLALWSARIAFLGHDAGHRQVAVSPVANRRIGLVCGNLLSGLSQGWWQDKHSRHHAHPNDVERDPDVGPGVIVWTPGQAGARAGFARWFARHQGGLFVPLLLLEALNLKVSGARDVLRRRDRTEAVLLGVHYAVYLGGLFAVLPVAPALTFVAVHQGLLGLHLGLSFAPNHKGMPMPAPGQRWTHLQRQVLTSRNVRGHAVTDWLLGGLNRQIEHHLFPSAPRVALKQLQPLVRAHCAAAGLPYVQTGPWSSYRQALRHLRRVGA